jgi:DNA topoisomerase-2
VEEVIDDFYGVRMNLYKKRKEFLVKEMEKKMVKLSNRARYIQETLKGAVDLRRKKADEVTNLLTTMNFAKIDDDFKYLIKMPMDSVTEENVASIMKEKSDTEAELDALKAKTLEQMWLGELEDLEKQYGLYKKKRVQIQSGTGKVSVDKKKKLLVKK